MSGFASRPGEQSRSRKLLKTPNKRRPIPQSRINHVFLVAPVRALWVRSLADEIEPKLAARASKQALLPLWLIALHLAEIEIGLVAQWLLARAPVEPERIAEALLATTRSRRGFVAGIGKR